jgi:hypothetical protein
MQDRRTWGTYIDHLAGNVFAVRHVVAGTPGHPGTTGKLGDSARSGSLSHERRTKVLRDSLLPMKGEEAEKKIQHSCEVGF